MFQNTGKLTVIQTMQMVILLQNSAKSTYYSNADDETCYLL